MESKFSCEELDYDVNNGINIKIMKKNLITLKWLINHFQKLIENIELQKLDEREEISYFAITRVLLLWFWACGIRMKKLEKWMNLNVNMIDIIEEYKGKIKVDNLENGYVIANIPRFIDITLNEKPILGFLFGDSLEEIIYTYNVIQIFFFLTLNYRHLFHLLKFLKNLIGILYLLY